MAKALRLVRVPCVQLLTTLSVSKNKANSSENRRARHNARDRLSVHL